jgi:VRR-NUC domain
VVVARRETVIPPESERQLQTAVIELARTLRWKDFHPWTSIHSPKGFPDLVLCKPPRLVLAELKRDDGRVTRAQREWLNALASCRSIEVCEWRPSDWQLIVATLQDRA